MNDDNLETLFEDDGNTVGVGSPNIVQVAGARSGADFQALVQYHITVMTSTKNSARVRVESALWLGESGETDAIRPLLAVYKRDKKNPKVQKAAAYALGMFKALDAAIYREPHETVEDALERPENAEIGQTLGDIAFFDRRGSRAGGRRWLRMMFILLSVLIALFTAYVLMPKSALTKLITPPTPTITPTIDPNAPTATPTFTPSMTPTITPTPTSTPGIPPEEVRTIQSELLALTTRAATKRDFLDTLTTAWTTIAQNPSQATITSICSSTPPSIPPDYVLPEGYGALNPMLGQATDYINSGLSLARNGWAYLLEGCAQGAMTSARIQTGLATVRTAQDSFNAADSLLNNR